MLKKFPSDKINGTKNALFFLLRAPTHYGFTFNLRFLAISAEAQGPSLQNCVLDFPFLIPFRFY